MDETGEHDFVPVPAGLASARRRAKIQKNKGEMEELPTASRNITEQLGLKNKLALLVFLRVLIGLVVFPAHRLFALAAGNIADDVSTRRHVSLARLARIDVDNAMEEVGLAMLAPKVLCSREKSPCQSGKQRCNAVPTPLLVGTRDTEGPISTYSADYVVMVGKMGFARFAPVDLAAV